MKLVLRAFLFTLLFLIGNQKQSSAFYHGIDFTTNKNHSLSKDFPNGAKAAFIQNINISFAAHSEIPSISLQATFCTLSHDIYGGFCVRNISEREHRILKNTYLRSLLYPFHSFD